MHTIRRLGALVTALALLLTACASEAAAPAEIGSASYDAERPAVSGTLMTDSAPAADPVPKPLLTQEDVDQALAQVMEHYSAAAVSVAVVENGLLSQSGAWGWAVKGEREMTPDTKVRIASISKVVIAMTAMAMAEDGILDLDAPLSDYWGAGVRNPYSKGQPSVRTLMTHTSSVKNLDTTRGLSHLKSLLSRASSWRGMEPGSKGYWYYSNFGMCVLGTTMELAWNGLLEDYLQQRILQPLDIHASFFAETLGAGNLVNIYTPSGVGLSVKQQMAQVTPTQIGQSASYFPGGFTISSVDLAKLVAVLVNDGVYKQPLTDFVQIEIEPAEGGERGEKIANTILQILEKQCVETRVLSEESVAAIETPYFTVDPGSTSPFEQCLILRRQEDILGQEMLYYHTGA